MTRRRKYRKKRSKFADAKIAPVAWGEWKFELALMGELAGRSDGLQLAIRLQDDVQERTGLRFDGTVASWKRICDEAPNALPDLKANNPVFFEGCNAWVFALIAAFTVPGEELDAAAIETATKRMIVVLSGLSQPSSQLSTRAKALHLILEARAANETAEGSIYRRVQRLFENNRLGADLRLSWLHRRVISGETVSEGFIVELLKFGAEIPCYGDSYIAPVRRPWPIEGLAEIYAALNDLGRRVCEKLPPPTVPDVGDVLLGSLIRIRQLVDRILKGSQEDDGMVAEILLRSLSDSAIQFRWLLKKQDVTLYSQFKTRSFGSERDALERMYEKLKAAGMSDDDTLSTIRSEYAGLRERLGSWPELLDVVYGPWSDASTSSMARDVGDDRLVTTFQRASDATHGSWRSIEKYQLTACENPLHARHYKAAEESSRSAGIIPPLSALLTLLEVLAAFVVAVLPDSPFRAELEKLRDDLLAWIRDHQSSFGVLDWETKPGEA